MLKYDITSEYSRKKEEIIATFQEVEIKGNPFPGLRPFNIEESHLFFGREGHIDEILVKLSKNRFVTVIGYSGSGKSSIMHCGLIPVLYGGFVTEVGANWNIITTRPGSNPYQNLAASILKGKEGYNELSDSDVNIYTTVISSVLKSSSGGFVDAIKDLYHKKGENIFLLVDQFEELMRYADQADYTERAQEAAAYVQMILEAVRQTEVPIYVALTLRSDFIGRCANYAGLTDEINESNYLVPQMAREQKRLVVEGPVAVGGGHISKRLVKKLLNDISDHQDQLPLLQHVMMRTWDYWVLNHDEGEPIDLRHYHAVGGVAEALSQHADEAFDELSARQKEIAEVLFKTLTLKTRENQGIRQVAKVSVVAEISGASEEDVIDVIEEFRKPGRSFLMPPPYQNLTGDSNIEISHESLMRIWSRLKAWVDEEYESAQMYKRLSEAAAMYQIGKTGLWRPPDLQLALNWQKKQRPNRAWAQRYDEAFERAIIFLDTSRITYEAEQKNQEMVQKRLLRRARAVAVLLGAATVVVMLFFVFAMIQRSAAVKEKNEALKQEQLAKDYASKAEDARLEAEKTSKVLALTNQDLVFANAELEERAMTIEQQRKDLQTSFNQISEANIRIQEQTNNAILAKEEALINKGIAEDNYLRANSLLGLSVAQSMAVKSLFIEEPDLRSLVAQQAYNFHSKNNGRINDPYIYEALHNALDKQAQGNYNSFNLSSDAVRSVKFGSTHIYLTGSDGNVLKIDKTNPADKTLLLANKYPNRFLVLSPDEKFLVVGSDSAYLQIIPTGGGRPTEIKGHSAFVYDVVFLNNSSLFYSLGADREIRINDPSKGTSSLFKKLSYPAKSIALHRSGNRIALGTEDSKVYLLDVQSKTDEQIITKGRNNPAHTVEFHPGGKHLAIGYEKGSVDIYDMAMQQIRELVGHTSKVSKVAFSKDGNYLASASFDKTIRLYPMNELDELPTVLKDHNGYVWDVNFDPGNDYLIAAVGDGIIKLWPVRSDLMGNKICDIIFRNMSKEEWKIYAGDRMDYEKTCTDKPDLF